MTPAGFLTGVLLGSAAAIALVLAMIVAVFALNLGDQPVLREEFPSLLAALALFAVLAGVAAAAFLGLQRGRAWRWYAQGAMWLVVTAIAWYYWPPG